MWDSVRFSGVPLCRLRHLFSRRYKFHDVKLNGGITYAYHLLAEFAALTINEKRGTFKLSLWSNEPEFGQIVEQVWVVEVHFETTVRIINRSGSGPGDLGSGPGGGVTASKPPRPKSQCLLIW